MEKKPMTLTKNGAVYRLNKTEPVKALRTSRKFQITSYTKLVVPVSMRSIYWQYFGFPADNEGEIISKSRIVCVICRGQIAYNRNTSNLRMHLQNKHMEELTAIESQATPKTCKTKAIKNETIPDELSQGENIREYYALSSTNELQLDLDEMPVYVEDTTTTPTKTPVRVVHNVEVHTIHRIITNFLILDLERPEVVLGKGFHRLLLSIENPASVPNVPVLVDEILPKKYQEVKNKLLKDIGLLTEAIGLTFEEWQCVEGRWYCSVCVYYHSNNTVVCKMLSTFTFLPEMDVHTWESMLMSLFGEWSIGCDRVAAAVCSMEREAMTDALENLGVPVVPCLDFCIKESVRQCFADEVIKEIISKVRRQMSLFKNCPAFSNQAAESSKDDELPSLIVDVESVWLTTLEMLEVAYKWRHASKKITESAVDASIESLLEICESEWEIIGDLIEALQPLKMTLMSICEEKVPFLSLVRPMLYQVIEHKLNADGEQSETSVNLKKAIVGILNYRYTPEKVANILNIATVVDPRFRVLPDLSEEDILKIGEMVHGASKNVVVPDVKQEKDANVNRRKSHISMLLGELKRTKKDKDEADGASNWEYQTYLSQENIGLEHDPLQWWKKNQDKFPRVGHLAEKYFCVPAVTTLPGKRTAENYFNFHVKRSTLSADVVCQLLFLNVNS